MGKIVDPRTWLEHIGPAECWELLASQRLARLAVVVERRPEIFPVNIAVSDHQTVVFRTAKGTKLTALGDIPAVALEVDGMDVQQSTGWSILVSGSARHVHDPELIRVFEQLDLEPWVPGHKPVWVEIAVDSMSGRRINPPADS